MVPRETRSYREQKTNVLGWVVDRSAERFLERILTGKERVGRIVPRIFVNAVEKSSHLEHGVRRQ